MPIDLPELARRKGIRRKAVVLRPIQPSAMLERDLAAIYRASWQTWRDHRDRIVASYTPTPIGDGDTLVHDTAADTSAAIDLANADFLTRLVATITSALGRWTVRAEQVHRNRWAAAVNAGVGIDLSTILTGGPVQETMAAFLERNVALVKDISQQAQSKIADAVFRGYQNRSSVRDVAKEIDGAIGFGRKRALRVAADQNSKLSAALDTERQVEASITKFRWRHSAKRHPRLWHLARDGKIYFVKSGKAVDGSETIPPDDRAGRPPWCGCREQAYIDLMGELGI